MPDGTNFNLTSQQQGNSSPPATAAPGLINSSPGQNTSTPGQNPTPAGGDTPVTSGTPVTSYNAAQASTTPYVVDPTTGTTAGQISSIISSGSPLMQQARTNAAEMANQRGLLNSTQAISAGEQGLINAALPIAQTDSGYYNSAMQKTADAMNANAQFNAGQTNTALGQASQASNALENTLLNNLSAYQIQKLQNEGSLQNIMAQGGIQEQITKMENNNKLLLQASAGAAQFYSQSLQYMQNIVTNADMPWEDRQKALQDMVNSTNDMLNVMSNIGNTPDVSSLLTFNSGTSGSYNG